MTDTCKLKILQWTHENLATHVHHPPHSNRRLLLNCMETHPTHYRIISNLVGEQPMWKLTLTDTHLRYLLQVVTCQSEATLFSVSVVIPVRLAPPF